MLTSFVTEDLKRQFFFDTKAGGVVTELLADVEFTLRSKTFVVAVL